MGYRMKKQKPTKEEWHIIICIYKSNANIEEERKDLKKNDTSIISQIPFYPFFSTHHKTHHTNHTHMVLHVLFFVS